MTVSVRPSPTSARDYSFPAFERHELPNGLAVVIAPVRKLPLVTINAVVDAGGETDPASKSGLAQLTAQLLSEGTTKLDAASFTERMELLGSSLATMADWDSVTISLSVMSPRVNEALEMLADVIMRPALPERELERLRAQRLAELLQMKTEPRSLADEMYAALLYDPASRYSRPLGGWESSVKDISLADVRQFHASRYAPASTTLLIVGDIEAGEVLEAVKSFFSSWNGVRSERISVDARASAAAPHYYLVTKENAPQSELRVGHIGLPRKTPDYFSVVVMNALLGGLFSSRINLNLREQRGYTYGAFSQFDWRRAAGPFVVATAVKSDVTGESVAEIMKEIERMRTEPVGDEELSLALNYLMGVFPIRFETTAAIAGALAAIVTYGLPVDYFDQYRTNIGAVTAAHVLRAAADHLKPDDLRVVVVGDPEVVRGQLEKIPGANVALADIPA